jgi:hypothetical protein
MRSTGVERVDIAGGGCEVNRSSICSSSSALFDSKRDERSIEKEEGGGIEDE